MLRLWSNYERRTRHRLRGRPARRSRPRQYPHRPDGRPLAHGERARPRRRRVPLPTASGHLSKLADAQLLTAEKQGRHRYFRLSGPDVAQVIEALMGLAQRTGAVRVRTGPKDEALASGPHLLRPHGRRTRGRASREPAPSRAGRRRPRPRSDTCEKPLFRSLGHRRGPARGWTPPGLSCLSRLERARQPSGRRARCRDPDRDHRASMGLPGWPHPRFHRRRLPALHRWLAPGGNPPETAQRPPNPPNP